MTPFSEWDDDLAAALAEPFAPGDHKDMTQGGRSITFVDVHKYKERLNATVGPQGWTCSVRLDPVGGKLIAVVALTVLGVTKENVGDEVEVPEVNAKGNEKIIGSPSTNSYAQAFKRACSDFGLGAYLYDEAKRNAAKRGGGSRNGNSGGAKATPKQMAFLESLMKSSAFTEAERDKVSAKVASADKATVSGAIQWAQDEIEKRKVPA